MTRTWFAMIAIILFFFPHVSALLRVGVVVLGTGPYGPASSYYWRAAQLVEFLVKNARNTTVQRDYALTPDEIVLLPNETLSLQLLDNQFRVDLTSTQTLSAVDFCNVSVPVDVLVGPPHSASAIEAARIATTFNIPILSQGAPSTVLNDRVLYPTFSRNYPSDSLSPVVITNLLMRFGWNRVALLFDDGISGAAFALTFTTACATRGITIAVAQSVSLTSAVNVNTASRAAAVTAALRVIKASGALVIVLAIGVADVPFADLVGQPAQTLGMMGPGAEKYVWIGAETMCVTATQPLGPLATGLLCPAPYVNTRAPVYQLFTTRLRRFVLEQFNETLPPDFAPFTFVNHYDTMFLLARALTRFSQVRDQHRVGRSLSWSERTAFLPWLRNTTWAGATGFLQMDINGNRVMPYVLMNRRPDGLGETMDLFDLKGIGLLPSNPDPTAYVAPLLSLQPRFADGTTTVPPDRIIYTKFRQGESVESDWTLRTDLLVLSFAVAAVGSWAAIVLMDNALVARMLLVTHEEARVHVSRRIKLEFLAWTAGAGLAQSVAVLSAVMAALASLRLQVLPVSFDATWIASPIVLAFPLATCSLACVLRTVRLAVGSKDGLDVNAVIAFQPLQDVAVAKGVRELSRGSSAKSTSTSSSTSHSSSHSEPGNSSSSSSSSAFRKYQGARKQDPEWWQRGGSSWFAIAVLSLWLSGFIVGMMGVRSVKLPTTAFLGLAHINAVSWTLWTLSLPLHVCALILYAHWRRSVFRPVAALVQASAWFFVALGTVLGSRSVFAYGWTWESEDSAAAQAPLRESDLQSSNATITPGDLYLSAIAIVSGCALVLVGASMARLRLARDQLDALLLRGQQEVVEIEAQRDLMRAKRDELEQQWEELHALLADDVIPGHPLDPIQPLEEKSGSHVSLVKKTTEVALEGGATSSMPFLRLQDVLEDHLALEAFKMVARNRRVSENIHFLIELDRMCAIEAREVHEPSLSEARLALGKLLIHHYIRENSLRQLNISQDMRAPLLSASQKDLNTALFDQAKREVIKLIMTNEWTPFLKHPLAPLIARRLGRRRLH